MTRDTLHRAGRGPRSKGAALFAVILGMLIFGALGMSMASLVTSGLEGGGEGLASAQAFDVAEGGMQVTLMSQLVGDTDFSDNVSPTGAPFGGTPTSLSPGQFWAEYLNQQTSSITVRVTARVGNAVRMVEQTVGQGGSGFQYVTMAEGNINMNSSTGNIFGDVGLTGTANIGPGVTVNGNIYEDPDLELPTLDMPTYWAMCDSTYNGNLTISANYTGDLCVNGNVRINANNVTFTGLLYATGNVQIDGNNVVFNGSLISGGNINGDGRTGLQFNAQMPEPDVHMPAIVGDGNIDFKNADGMQVTGVIWNTGNIDFTNTDNLVYTGSFMTDGNVIMNSALNMLLTFDADLLVGVPGLEGVGGEVTGSLSLSGWKTYY